MVEQRFITREAKNEKHTEARNVSKGTQKGRGGFVRCTPKGGLSVTGRWKSADTSANQASIINILTRYHEESRWKSGENAFSQRIITSTLNRGPVSILGVLYTPYYATLRATPVILSHGELYTADRSLEFTGGRG